MTDRSQVNAVVPTWWTLWSQWVAGVFCSLVQSKLLWQMCFMWQLPLQQVSQPRFAVGATVPSDFAEPLHTTGEAYLLSTCSYES